MFYKKQRFIDEFVGLIKECDLIVLGIYNTDFEVELKDDQSPLTIADEECNKHICFYLNLLTKKLEESGEIEESSMIIISEENKNMDYARRKQKKWCWLVDPIDGTKEFVKRNGQFTVNIGLSEDGVPVFGIVSIPVSGDIYYGAKGVGSFKLDNKNTIMSLEVDREKKYNKVGVKIIASSSHLNEETKEFIDQYELPEIINVGSSIKLLWIAENKAEIYPRLAPTSEWDTCAAHAVVKYAGGSVVSEYERSTELAYNKQNLLNPYFIAF
jgi:3'(2'), 5'-bisphosphate nucleotidase